MSDELNELLRELISAQDDSTAYNERLRGMDYDVWAAKYYSLLVEAQKRRDRIRAEIVALFEQAKGQRP